MTLIDIVLALELFSSVSRDRAERQRRLEVRARQWGALRLGGLRPPARFGPRERALRPLPRRQGSWGWMGAE